MATLVSPGVSVSVIDQSNYAPNGPGTVPFILLATAANKSSTAGGIATYTTSSTVNTLHLVTSQKDLLNNYGLPSFPSDASGNRIYGSELAEYGLMAAHSTLGVTNQAYILRANIDLYSLNGRTTRPYGNPIGGTQWLDTALTNWGIFQLNNNQFVKQAPQVITDSTLLNNGIPYSNVGTVGSYAVNSTDVKNTIYQKAYDNTWNQIGSTAWQSKTPAIVGSTQATNLSTSSTSLIINNNTFTIANAAPANLVATINSASIPGVSAALINGYFNLFATSAASTYGNSYINGGISISNGTGTPLTNLGISAGTYFGPILQYSPSYTVPAWKSTDSLPRPNGSIWMKTNAINNGANFYVYRWNSATDNWDSVAAPAFRTRRESLYYFDPLLGGLAIAQNTLFVKYDILGNSSGSYKLYQWLGNGAPTTVTGNVSNPTFNIGDSFNIQVTIPGSSAVSSTYAITLTGTTAANFVSQVLSANIPYLTCTLTPSGNIKFSHTNSGDIYISEVSGTPISVSAGIVPNSTQNVFFESNAYSPSATNYMVLSNWQPALLLNQQSTAPIVAPEDGTLWYYSSPLEADIMINDGTAWRGYHSSYITRDSRGYTLSNTDPLGPIFSPTPPLYQSGGVSVTYGDLWIDTSDLENYPQIYRWQNVAGTSQWVLINNSDNTTENGILFADARWDSSGTTDPALDAKPLISTLITSDYVDLDVPNPQIYPRGMLLFNTRRSSYNVKKFENNAWNSADYPLVSLPTVKSTWNSYSGKNSNNVPYMGRKAQRNVIVSALKEAVDSSIEAREDQINFNLLVCPGYPELTQNLATLNNDRRNTGFIIADTPMGLSSDPTMVNNYITNSSGAANDGEDGLVTNDPYVAVYYPGAAWTNALDGVGQVVVPMTHAILRMIIKSDQSSAPWFAPAGALRGKIDNAIKIGYVDRMTGSFYSIGTNQGLRDLLYQNNVNPVAVFPVDGILAYGNHTRQANATALDRINVARLVNYLRYSLERLAKPLVFEPNDTVTRNAATQAVSGLLNNIVAQRGIYDYLVVCDTTNNTPTTIDRNELHIDIAIEPTKAVEFIYIPVRILNTGAIAGTGANQGGLSNTTSSVALGTVTTTG